MPVCCFIEDFDWAPPEFNGRWLVAYKAGTVELVTTPCAEAAIAAGKAIKSGEITESGEGAAEAGVDPAGGAKRRKTGSRAKR